MKTEPIINGIIEARQALFAGEASVDSMRPIFGRMGLRPTDPQLKAVSLGLGITNRDLLEIISVFREQAWGKPLSDYQIAECLQGLEEAADFGPGGPGGQVLDTFEEFFA
jgi:hypothetical protein